MKNLTKLAIRKKLLEKLEEQPLSKISVRTICDELGINHNTFYYYYADIYAVIQEYFDENLESVEAVYSRTDSWELSFLEAVRPVMKNRRAVYHIYYSIRKEDLEQYLYSVSGNIMQAFVDSILPELPAKEEDRKLIAHFYRCALTNIVLHWIADGMKQEPKDMITRIGYLFNGSIEEALRRSAVSSAGADAVRAGQQVEDTGAAGQEQHGAENAGAMPPGLCAAEDAGTLWPEQQDPGEELSAGKEGRQKKAGV